MHHSDITSDYLTISSIFVVTLVKHHPTKLQHVAVKSIHLNRIAAMVGFVSGFHTGQHYYQV